MDPIAGAAEWFALGDRLALSPARHGFCTRRLVTRGKKDERRQVLRGENALGT